MFTWRLFDISLFFQYLKKTPKHRLKCMYILLDSKSFRKHDINRNKIRLSNKKIDGHEISPHNMPASNWYSHSPERNCKNAK